MFILLPLLAPVLRRLSVRTRMMTGVPLLLAGLALIFASGLFVSGIVLGVAGLTLSVSAMLRRPPTARASMPVERVG